MSEPVGDPQFRVDHAWTDGSLSSSKWIDPCDQDEVLSVVDATIDASTGLPASVRDAAELETAIQRHLSHLSWIGRVHVELVTEIASRAVSRRSRSASANTMVGFFPPISICARAILCASCR